MMRKLVLFMHISLDGFAAGTNGELNWVSYDEELKKYAEGIVKKVGTPVYGRVTYQMMENYWPTVLKNPSATQAELAHARWIENVEKIVFSKTLTNFQWKNTKVIKDNIVDEIQKLKEQPGGDLVIFGSPGLAHSLMEFNCIDEYQLTLNPVLLGQGIPLFKNIHRRNDMTLIHSTTLKSGVLGLHYKTKLC